MTTQRAEMDSRTRAFFDASGGGSTGSTECEGEQRAVKSDDRTSGRQRGPRVRRREAQVRVRQESGAVPVTVQHVQDDW